MLSCEEFARNNEALLAGTLGLRARISACLHLLVCENCRRYLQQLKLMIGALPGLKEQPATEAIDKVVRTLQ